MATALQLTEELEPHEAAHAARLTALALRLARALDVSAARVEAIRVGGPLHDIGKLAVDRAILDKPGELEPAELAAIRTHPVIGARMVKGLRAAIDCVLHHHERWDGAGYPHGLGGHEIPLEARILAVADAYDAMTSDRPYRGARSHDEALAEVERCAGSQFDPQVAETLLRL